MPNPIPDLNDTIASAVHARVEAEVLASLSNSETFGAFVVAALQQPVERPGSYDRNKTTFLAHTLQTTIQAETKRVVAEEVAGLDEKIRGEVRKALRKSVGVLADALVDGFVASAEGRFPSVKVTFPGMDD